MKFLLALVLTILVAFLVQYFNIGSWWSLAVVTFITGVVMKLNAWKSFAFGFLAIVLVWGGYAYFLNDLNNGILAAKMGVIFKGLDVRSLIAVSALIGGIVGGLGAMTGRLAWELVGK